MIKIYIKNFITRILICIILFLSITIYCNISDKNLLLFKNKVLNDSINFSWFNNIYKKYVGKYIPFDVYDEKVVMSDKLVYSSKKKYLNGVSLNVGKDYNLKSILGGLVVYIGKKDKLGNTIIIQGTDGIDYWYSNINDLSVSLYDYIEKNTLLGVSIDDEIYLTFVKDGKYLNYEEYI